MLVELGHLELFVILAGPVERSGPLWPSVRVVECLGHLDLQRFFEANLDSSFCPDELPARSCWSAHFVTCCVLGVDTREKKNWKEELDPEMTVSTNESIRSTLVK